MRVWPSRSRSVVPVSRPIVMARAKQRVTGGGDARVGVQVLLQVQRAPVGQRAFAVRRAERRSGRRRRPGGARGRRVRCGLPRAPCSAAGAVRRRRGLGGAAGRGPATRRDQQADRGEQRAGGVVGDRPPATSPPSPAPSMPPRLNAAWKLGITGRRSAATRSTAALFMATLIPPYAAAEDQQDRARARAPSGSAAAARR